MGNNPFVPEHNQYSNFNKEIAKVKAPTLEDLFPRIDRWGIGILDTLDSFKAIANTKPSYPPYNIIRDKALGGLWEIDIALAGVRKDSLEVYVQERTLVVRTNPKIDLEGEDIREVLHQGIAQRNFELKFALADHIELTSAKLQDGILNIKLNQELPEEKQPKYIDIQ